LFLVELVAIVPFSALTLLLWQQEERLVCKKFAASIPKDYLSKQMEKEIKETRSDPGLREKWPLNDICLVL